MRSRASWPSTWLSSTRTSASLRRCACRARVADRPCGSTATWFSRLFAVPRRRGSRHVPLGAFVLDERRCGTTSSCCRMSHARRRRMDGAEDAAAEPRPAPSDAVPSDAASLVLMAPRSSGQADVDTLADGTAAFRLRFRADGRRARLTLHERRECDCGCGGGWTERTARVELENVLARVRAPACGSPRRAPRTTAG